MTAWRILWDKRNYQVNFLKKLVTYPIYNSPLQLWHHPFSQKSPSCRCLRQLYKTRTRRRVGIPWPLYHSEGTCLGAYTHSGTDNLQTSVFTCKRNRHELIRDYLAVIGFDSGTFFRTFFLQRVKHEYRIFLIIQNNIFFHLFTTEPFSMILEWSGWKCQG